MKNTDLISIIIPCYNAQNFIERTIKSVLHQTYDKFEIIIIDDGSKDNSKNVISSINSDKLSYYYQDNSGVSTARNKGLSLAKGDYVLFLDADDIISENCIEKRVSFLENNRDYNACCSSIHTINEKDELIDDSFFNISRREELLNFENGKYSCPSGYLFRTSALEKNKLTFNNNLSSSADKYFLYNFFINSKIGVVLNSPLMYRVFSNSMSNNLTSKLIDDQVMYLSLLKKNKIVPKKYHRAVFSRINYTIGASYYKLRLKNKAIKYLINSFIKHPEKFLKLLLKKS